MFVQGDPLGGSGRSQQGERHFFTPNPPVGATFTYWLCEDHHSRKDARQEREGEVEKKGGSTFYPSWDSLRAEAREEDPTIVLTVLDEQSRVVRRVEGPASKGIHRVTWDFRRPSVEPPTTTPRERDEFSAGDGSGP